MLSDRDIDRVVVPLRTAQLRRPAFVYTLAQTVPDLLFVFATRAHTLSATRALEISNQSVSLSSRTRSWSRHALMCCALAISGAVGIAREAQAETSAGAVQAAAAYAPDLLAPTDLTTVDGAVVAPAIADQAVSTDVLATQGSLTDSRIATNPAAGVQFGTGWGYLSVVPLHTSADAGGATVVNDAAAVFEGTGPGSDTIIRPSALGVSIYTQIRSQTAPETYSWRLSLPGGLILKPMDDGSIAILASPARPMSTSATDAFDGAVAASEPPPSGVATATVPPQPASADDTAAYAAETQTPQEQAVPDAHAQVIAAAQTLASAGRKVDGEIVAAIQKPWAVDAAGTPVPVSLSVERDILTMTVDYKSAHYQLPIIADPDLIDCAHVSPCGRYRARRAAAYAAKWRTDRNSSYKSFDADCTNFMSQILRAGGLAQMREYETGEGSWWMTKNGPFFAPWNWTHSWSVSDTLQDHLREYGLARVTKSAYRPGDFIAYDWEPDGTYDHINFVYSVRRGEPYLLQHTPDYSSPRAFSDFKAEASTQFGKFKYIHLRPVHAFANIN